MVNWVICHGIVQKIIVRQRGEKVVQYEVEYPKAAEVVENIPKEGESLIMRKVLLKVGEDTGRSVERRNLFEIYCKARGNCCKLIIDSGNTDNLVSIEMVDKLKLRNTVHPEPYRVAWLQKGHQVLVREQCQVSF